MDWGVNVFRKPGTPQKNNIPKNHGISKLVVWRSRPRLYTSKPLYSRVQWGMRKGKTTIWTCISYWFSTIMLVFWWVTFWGGLIFGRSKGNLLWEYLSMTWPSSTNMPLKVTDVVRAVSTSFHPLPPSKGGRRPSNALSLWRALPTEKNLNVHAPKHMQKPMGIEVVTSKIFTNCATLIICKISWGAQHFASRNWICQPEM